MFSLWIVGALFVPLFSHENCVGRDVEKLLTYVPLGRHHIFNCETESQLGHPVHVVPNWTVEFYDPEVRQMERMTVKAMRTSANERFRQLNNNSLLVIGLQQWHDGVVVECTIEKNNSTRLISSYKIVIQDCSDDRKNPCHYGTCSVEGFDDLFQAVLCKCSPHYTGDFCTDPVDNMFLRRLFFFSPLILGAFGFVCLYLFSHEIEFMGKIKLTKFDKHLPRPPLVPFKELYPAESLSEQDAKRILDRREEEERKDSKEVKQGSQKIKEDVTQRSDPKEDATQKTVHRL